MKIGCPTEIKPQEFRVGMTPNAVGEAVNNGHQVLIQTGTEHRTISRDQQHAEVSDPGVEQI